SAVLVFFFQAEDGIRDRNVTGVQTCALPILDSYGHGKVLKETIQDLQREKITVGYTETLADMDTVSDLQGYRERMRKDPKKKRRSEERRVGKERRSRWGAAGEKRHGVGRG